MRKHQAILGAALLALSSLAGAHNLKPGLWEVTHKTQLSNGDAMAQMQKEMVNMPPEQRKMVEEMMSRHGTRQGAGGPGGGMSVKMCMTREMAERNQVAQQRDDCKTTMQPRAGNTIRMTFTCTQPPSSGEGQLTMASPEAYNLKMVINTKVDGKAEKASVDSAGKWLSADCGNIKPVK